MMGQGGNRLLIGSIFKLDAESTVATSLKITEGRTPIAKFGYKRKVKNYMVNNCLNTNGTLKTMFTYM